MRVGRLVCGLLLLAPAGAAPAAPPSIVSGFVRDADGPVAGATVRLQATDIKTESAEDGRFALACRGRPGAVTATAWADGYYVGWTDAHPGDDNLLIKLRPYPTSDDPNRAWFSHEGTLGSASCGHCMPGPYREWRADAHSRSAVNPRFLTVYRGTDMQGHRSPPTRYSLDRDYGRIPLPPDLTQPYRGPGYQLDFPDNPGDCATCHVPAAAAIPGREYAADPTLASGIETEGVFCELCHRIGDVVLDPATGTPYPQRPGVLSLKLCRPTLPEQLFFGPFDDVTRRVSCLPLQQDSAFCAPCHYGVFWDALVYNSYGEWQASDYSDPDTGRTCQDCHMPRVRSRFFALPEFGGLPRRGRIRSHRMPGAADLALLRSAARLEVDAERRGARIEVEVHVTNENAGHDLPTDHPARNMLLVLSATDRNGRPLQLVSGRTIPEWGGRGPAPNDYAGRPGKGYAKVLEERWTGVWPSIAYWNPTIVRDDTRIPARATDVTSYEFQAPDSVAPAVITARLIYRRAFRALAQQKGWDVPDVVMAEARTRVGQARHSSAAPRPGRRAMPSPAAGALSRRTAARGRPADGRTTGSGGEAP